MIKTIIGYEVLNLYRERLVIFILIATTLFTLMGLSNGQKRVDEQIRTIEKILTEQKQAADEASHQLQQRLTNRNSTNRSSINWWDDVADVRGYAFYLMVDYAAKTPSPFAAIAVGQSDIYPYFFRMLVDTKQTVLQDKNTEHPLVRYLGQFDLAFFLVFILPLLLIALNFNAVTQERDRHQLRLLVVQGLQPSLLLLLQLIVRTSIILLPILVITTTWLLVHIPNFNHVSLGKVLIQLLATLLMVMAYSMVWVSLSAWCITKGKSAAHNASVLISCWLISTIAIPMASNTLVNYFSPMPSRVSYINDLRAATDRVERDTEKALAGFFQDHPELANKHKAPKQDYAVIKIAKIDAIEKAMQGMEQQFATQLDAQYQLGNKLKWLSPASLFYQSLINVSENGLHQHRIFMQAVEAHHRELRRYFQQKIIAASERGDFNVCEGCQAPVTFSEFSEQPRFKLATNNHMTNHGLGLLTALIIAINLLMMSLLRAAGRKLNAMEVAQ